ncbi:hypothetical protein CALVIDRAFT_540249 [Calocera viscosa TUFC12733]|uniref:Uncharacterized protein n=1 Tax=Calocera viscosa (strain TUFC12733) TaxID=1330018 RepID=A0A167J5K8_CALVF|nr:hypothetical protein CALVIDRAFT_540249 [Calocera viscosa TUFC12733]
MEEPEGGVAPEHQEFHDEAHIGEEGPHEFGGEGGEFHMDPEHMPAEPAPEEYPVAHYAAATEAEQPPWHEQAFATDAPPAPEPEGVPIIARSVRSIPSELPPQAAPEPLYYQVPPLDPSAPVVDATTFGMQSPGTRVKKEALFDGALVLYIDEEAKVDVGKLMADGQVIFDTPVPEGWKIDAIITFPAGLALNPA